MSESTEASTQKNALENTVSIKDTFVQGTVTATAQTLADLSVDILQGQRFQGIRISVHDTNIRMRDDGGLPTNVLGTRMGPGIYWFSKLEAGKLQLIAESIDTECTFQPQTFKG